MRKRRRTLAAALAAAVLALTNGGSGYRRSRESLALRQPHADGDPEPGAVDLSARPGSRSRGGL